MENNRTLEYALIVRKFELNEEVFVYRPERVLIGYIDNGIFYPEKGCKNYNSITDEYFNYSPEDEGFYLLNTDDETIEEYLSTEEDDIAFFEKKYMNMFLMGYTDSLSEEFVVTEMSLDDLVEIGRDIYFSVFAEDNEPVVECTMSIDQVIDMLEHNDYDKDKISDIMSQLKDEQRELEDHLKNEYRDMFNNFMAAKERLTEVREQYENDQIEITDLMESLEPVPISPKDQARILYKELKNRIIGQDSAIKTICYVLYKNSILEDNQKKTNCLLVGPTGCGKSEIINIISEVYKKPLVHVDSNSNTAAGYVGDSLTDNLATLMVKANGNKYAAEHGIIAFDEIDKRGGTDRGNVNGKMVLDSILRFAEGQEYNVEYRLDGQKRQVLFDTSNLTIFASGAFPEVFNEKLKKYNKEPALGFNAPIKSEDEKNSYLKELEREIELTHDDIATIGRMGPEFVGRFTVTTLHKLGIEELKRIMTESTISPLEEEISILGNDNIEMKYDDKFVSNIAKKAYQEGSGGRGIRNNLEKLFENIYERIIFEEDESLINENGKIILKGTVDEEGNLLIKGTNNKKIYTEKSENGKVKVKK